GKVILVAGGKYTTHRIIGREIVDTVLTTWKRDLKRHVLTDPLPPVTRSRTEVPVNPAAVTRSVEQARKTARQKGWEIPDFLWERYGAEALEVETIHRDLSPPPRPSEDPEGFPRLEAQLRFAVRNEMAMHLEDF